MSIFNGESLRAEIYGTSRGEKIGVKISGLNGFSFDENDLKKFLKRRCPNGEIYSTTRRETDEPIFLNGISTDDETDGKNLGKSGGKTVKINGEIVCEIYNENAAELRGKDDEFYGLPRPSHADYVRYATTGELDFSGGGEFSGRLTAPFAVFGGICKQILENEFGVKITAYLTRVGEVTGGDYYDYYKNGEKRLTNEEISAPNAEIRGKFPVFSNADKNDDFSALSNADKNDDFPALTNADKMIEEIRRASEIGDSVGATVQCVVSGLPIGLGGSLFGGTEGKIASVVYAIPAVKAVEFGLGSRFSESFGSAVNDGLRYDADGKIRFLTNYSGGINGGVTNGANVVFSASFRPTPTISKKQKTVDLINEKNVEIAFKGRNDSCVAVRAVPVVEAAAAIAVLDELLAVKKYED